MNHYCADSGSKRITTVQTRAPNLYCTDSGSKWRNFRKMTAAILWMFWLHFTIRKVKVKWPKASDKLEWRSFDQSYTVLQNSLRGSTTGKLNIFGDVVYEEGKERFGELQQRKTPPKQSGRWEREILQLVKERRLLRKAWRKAKDHKKECLKNLWAQIRTRLTNLRWAERIRKHRSRKARQGKFIYIAHFIHSGNSKCFWQTFSSFVQTLPH